MHRYNVSYPITGRVIFYGIEANNKKEAIQAAKILHDEVHGEFYSNDRLIDYEWDFIEKVTHGPICCIPFEFQMVLAEEDQGLESDWNRCIYTKSLQKSIMRIADYEGIKLSEAADSSKEESSR